MRTIHMKEGGNAAADVPRSPLGYSRGRWDGDALIVETTRLNWPYLNETGEPMGPSAKLVEHFSASADGSRLEYRLSITDPDMLTAPADGKRSWVWRPGEKVMAFNCKTSSSR